MSVSVVPAVDKGRRRRALDDEGEDDDTLQLPEATRPSECESEGEVQDIDLSEHESAIDESAERVDASEEGSETETDEASETETESGSETETEGEEGYSDDEGLEEERQSGDGEEQPNNDKPDDDEDKKNPAYVPRKGAFYEHDLRQGDEGPEEQKTVEEKPKKKLWQDEGKWAHDRYSDDAQAPKSREELIAIYGYDIRAGDKPPEAPPRRPGREKGPRTHRIKDFIPKMAVIDTTEDGNDSVPNLGDDGVILYGGPSPRNTRRSNMQNSDSRRGGRYNIKNEVDSYNIKNRSDSNWNSEVKNNQDISRSVEVASREYAQDEEFPRLEESVRPTNERTDPPKKQVDSNDQLKSEAKPSAFERSPKPQIPDNGRQNDFRDNNNKGFKVQQSQDIRRDNGRYQQGQGFREDRRGGFNGRNPVRDRDNYNRYQEENWRTAGEPKEAYYRNADYNSGNKQDFNRKPLLKGGDNRSIRGGNSSEGRGYSNQSNRGSRYEQPPRYQQQQQLQSDVSSSKESREYTNTSYRAYEDKSKPRNAFSGGVSNSPSGVSDSGDGSTSQNVVFSNKENVQTINVTITSTTTEKKSYAKERRAKGSARSMEGPIIAGQPDVQKLSLGSNVQYQGPPPTAVKLEPSTPSQSSAKRYSSQRQQGLSSKGVFTEPPPIESTGSNLYNPALPPPSYFREHGSVASSQLPTSAGVPESAHYPSALLPPPAAAAAIPYGLPVSTTVLPMPPNAQGIANPTLFQPTSGPPPVLAPSYLPAGLMYAGAPRVPPPGTPAGFPISIAYASPPPPPAAVAAVGPQPPPQGTVPQPGLQPGGQHKKVYRGDITYYAPELQQPSRTHQKRPKAAIPIIDPQAVPRQKQKSEQRTTPEKSIAPAHKSSSTNGNNHPRGNQSSAQVSNAQSCKSQASEQEDSQIPKQIASKDEFPSVESDNFNATNNSLPHEPHPILETQIKHDSDLVPPISDSEFLSKSIGSDTNDSKESLPQIQQSFKGESEIVESLANSVEKVTLIDAGKIKSEEIDSVLVSTAPTNLVTSADL